jgi:hypothetical protein
MPQKLIEGHCHQFPKARLRVTNPPEYGAAPVQREAITVWFTVEAVAAWHAPATGARGGQKIVPTCSLNSTRTESNHLELAKREPDVK